MLLVDFDPQGALSVGLGIQPHGLHPTVYNLLMGMQAAGGRCGVQDLGGRHGHLVPSNIDLSGAQVPSAAGTRGLPAGIRAGRGAGSPPAEYDVALIDRQPSPGLLAANALACAAGVLVLLECEYFALRGVALLLETIKKGSSRGVSRLGIDGLLATMYDSRTLHSREVLAEVVRGFGEKVFQTPLTGTVWFPDATVAGELQ